jgi:hypothetical protein
MFCEWNALGTAPQDKFCDWNALRTAQYMFCDWNALRTAQDTFCDWNALRTAQDTFCDWNALRTAPQDSGVPRGVLGGSNPPEIPKLAKYRDPWKINP